jgi:hypothetical protein
VHQVGFHYKDYQDAWSAKRNICETFVAYGACKKKIYES